MEMRGQQGLYGIIEVIATHNLLKYLRGNNPDERMRMAAGATMAGLGFVLGPELEERLQKLPNTARGIRKEVTLAAGGAVLGAVTAYLLRNGTRGTIPTPSGEDGLPAGSLGQRLSLALGEADPDRAAFDPAKPGGLVTIASAAWLGYSLFFDGKTKEEQRQHLWGLGAGALGYLYGPETIRWARGLRIPARDGERAVGIIDTGSVLFGAAVGGIVGYGVAKHGDQNA